LGFTNPQVFSALHLDDVKARENGKTLSSLRRWEIIVELRDDGDKRNVVVVPTFESVHRGSMQWRGQQDEPGNVVIRRVIECDLSAERPPDNPGIGQTALANESQCCFEIKPFVHTVTESAVRRPARARHSAEIEPEDSEVGEGRKAVRRLANDVRVHEPTRGRERVKKE
jgi:hypothetical protein